MRALLLVLFLVPAALGQAPRRPIAVEDVVYARAVFYLANGEAIVIEESSDFPRARSRPAAELLPDLPAARSRASAEALNLPAAGVPARQTFRSAPQYNPSHTCPGCGYTSPANQGTWIVRGFNADGTHTHQCPQCGTSWRH
jgi:predicted RNA-binding Zn-ribbon protein involved in translation (DUF1610 family)